MSVKEIKNVEEFNTALDGTTKYVFFDFYATWCGPCKKIEPRIKELSEEYPEIKFYKIDVDKVTVLAKQYSIKSMPTFMLFDVPGLNTFPMYKKIIGADAVKIENMLKSTRVNTDDDDF